MLGELIGDQLYLIVNYCKGIDICLDRNNDNKEQL